MLSCFCMCTVHTLYIHIYLHISPSVYFCVEKRAMLSERNFVQCLTPASHATGLNFSVNTALTSETEGKKVEETSEGGEGGKVKGRKVQTEEEEKRVLSLELWGRVTG